MPNQFPALRATRLRSRWLKLGTLAAMTSLTAATLQARNPAAPTTAGAPAGANPHPSFTVRTAGQGRPVIMIPGLASSGAAAARLYHESQMPFRKYRLFSSFPAIAAGLAVVLAGCKPLPPSMPASEWTAQEARGAAVYQVKCARCHYPTNTHSLHGPGLQALTKLKSMPSGAPPTDERMTDRILHGYGMMPPTALSDDQLRDLLAYLHTL